MTIPARDALYAFQHQAHAILSEGSTVLEGKGDDALAVLPQMRARLGEVLGAYQVFKHERVFDPAVATGDPECTKLGRSMKVECIAAGEAFRSHGQQWKPERIAEDWPNYRVAARLTLNALRRHLDNEREGIERLIDMLEARAARTTPHR
ncbi:hypothetical protein GCM10011380_27280 [Sphingomonas metalli]|uniref:Uncharacterized protein n=1 Tax=Sphingomonas metalli TaxID=1779358 RepID=A0A916TAF6_9SPHN|nr:hypothetical protein [Sphingomonas metalli]GGB36417.1 hypothetical protein GCM10011380_27280 [Sphingomonas metalli]